MGGLIMKVNKEFFKSMFFIIFVGVILGTCFTAAGFCFRWGMRLFDLIF